MNVVVTGRDGRMGEELARLVRADTLLSLHALTGPGELGMALGGADVLIDFTSPEGSVEHARLCAAARVPIVIGTTGFTPVQRAAIDEAAKTIPIVLAPNTSLGVNVLAALVKQAALLLPEFDIEIVELHHKHKKDAPSGTALRLAEAAKEITGYPIETDAGGPRKKERIGVAALRGGDVVGEHTVYFFGEGERVALTHVATSRAQFAKGAITAARWVAKQAPGLYGMEHVLGLV